MESNSLCVSPVSKIGTGAFIGLCMGTLAQPKRDSLRRMLVQKPGYFDETFNDKVLRLLDNEELAALENIKKGSIELQKAGFTENRKIRSAAKKWHKKFVSIKVDPAIEQRLINKKEFLKKAVQETDFINLNRLYMKTKSKLAEMPDNIEIRDEFVELAGKRKHVIEDILEFPIKEYREAVSAVKTDRLIKMKSLPNSGLAVKSLYRKMQEAISKKHTIVSNKLYELANTPLLKESYGKIHKFLPESRLGNALKGAATLGTLTAIGLVFFNPSTRN